MSRLSAFAESTPPSQDDGVFPTTDASPSRESHQTKKAGTLRERGARQPNRPPVVWGNDRGGAGSCGLRRRESSWSFPQLNRQKNTGPLFGVKKKPGFLAPVSSGAGVYDSTMGTDQSGSGDHSPSILDVNLRRFRGDLYHRMRQAMPGERPHQQSADRLAYFAFCAARVLAMSDDHLLDCVEEGHRLLHEDRRTGFIEVDEGVAAELLRMESEHLREKFPAD